MKNGYSTLVNAALRKITKKELQEVYYGPWGKAGLMMTWNWKGENVN